MCVLIGIAGGSCSGKTTFSRRAREKIGEDHCSILYQDNYYIDQSAHFDGDGGAVNFDHPHSLDFKLLAQHLRMLKQGENIPVPIYDFVSHRRKEESLKFSPQKIILLDGILILSQPEIVEILDDSYFIECSSETRFKRRLDRDVAERGRTPEGVEKQFFKQVDPMHKEFVEPSKVHAKHVLSQQEYLASCDDYIEDIINRYIS